MPVVGEPFRHRWEPGIGRATLAVDADGNMAVEPAKTQDSSMIGIYANANALIVRPPFDPPKSAGDAVMVMQLDPLL